MLPFLRPKHVAGVIISKRKPDGNTEMQGMEGEENDSSGLDLCSADLIRAIHAKDESATSAALRAAFDLMESEEHDQEDESSESNEQEGQV